MNSFRGIVLLAAGVAAIWRGLTTHAHRDPFTLYGLGFVAIALGVWHLARPARPRRNAALPPVGPPERTQAEIQEDESHSR